MGTLWSDIDLPEVPSLGEVRRYARERLAQTPSLEEIAARRTLEEIAARTRERLFELVFARLSQAASSPQSLPAV